MAASPPRAAPPRRPVPDGFLAGAVTIVGLLALVAISLLTPAFTDFEAEADPSLQALLDGRISDGLRLLPLYGGAVLLEFPFAGLSRLLGGGDLAYYRSVAVPGAIGVVALAVVGARWMREAGRERGWQLLIAGLFGLSPCVALAWNFGHPEEVLVSTLAIGGLVLVVRGGPRLVLTGGALLGLAIAAKAWAVVLFPVALACLATRRDVLRLLAAAGAAGVALLLPVILPKAQTFGATLTATGGDGISSKGNLWWFFGPRNPNFNATPGDARQLFTSDNSARFSPRFISDHGHELIVLTAVVLAALWWWRVARHQDRDAIRERMASALLIAAAIIWWRSVGDPWFQGYYLTAALFAVVLADARLGRLPTLGLVAWGALWLVHGQNAPDMGLSPDGTSALRLAWLLPVGVWLTTRALRPVR